MNWVSIRFLLTGGARFFFLAETDMELEWLFSHSFFVSVHPCCVEGEGVALNAMNEAYDLMMEKSKKISNQACNSRNMVYSMSSYRVLNQPHKQRSLYDEALLLSRCRLRT